MKFILFIIAAYVLGLLAAVPAGPVQIEVVRRSINGFLKSSLMVVLGAFLVDVFYGLIAFFGIAPFLEKKIVMAVFWLVGGLILIILGSLIIRHSLRPHQIDLNTSYLKKKRWAFLGGVSLSVTNPMMILWWLSAARIFEDVGLIDKLTPDAAAMLLASGSLGIASYLIGLALFLHWAKRFVSEEKIRRVNLLFGILLIFIAAYLLISSLRNF